MDWKTSETTCHQTGATWIQQDLVVDDYDDDDGRLVVPGRVVVVVRLL